MTHCVIIIISTDLFGWWLTEVERQTEVHIHTNTWKQSLTTMKILCSCWRGMHRAPSGSRQQPGRTNWNSFKRTKNRKECGAWTGFKRGESLKQETEILLDEWSMRSRGGADWMMVGGPMWPTSLKGSIAPKLMSLEPGRRCSVPLVDASYTSLEVFGKVLPIPPPAKDSLVFHGVVRNTREHHYKRRVRLMSQDMERRDQPARCVYKRENRL